MQIGEESKKKPGGAKKREEETTGGTAPLPRLHLLEGKKMQARPGLANGARPSKGGPIERGQIL